MHLIYLQKTRPVKLVNAPNSFGILPVRLLLSAFGNMGGISNSERTQHLE
jgi:hypothetical protein